MKPKTTQHPLRQYREDMGLSQAALGEKLGVTGMTIYRWERGERLPRRGQWPKITYETGVRPAEFLRFAKPGDAA